MLKKLVQSVRKHKRKFRPLMALALLPSVSFASYNTSDDVLTEVLTNAVDYAQSGPARALCVLAIAGAGYLWIGKGILPKAYAISVICGAGFIFGAGYIGSTVLGLSS